MTSHFFQFARVFAVVLVSMVFQCAIAQTIYFHQDFLKSGPFVNAEPDSSQYSHIVQTVPSLSYSKFSKGFMDLVRTQEDSATGGIIRVLRATPFKPNPETLFIQITISAESVQSAALNAMYFYVGEKFNPDNHSFPGNALMFAKFSLNFLEGGFSIKDFATQNTSKLIARKKQVTLTWVLNNSKKLLAYKLTPNHTLTYNALPGTYDLWVDNEPVSLNSKAYPGNSLFSDTKLSNFEMRFRNGQGKIRIHEILIRNGSSELKPGEAVVAPNPATRKLVTLRAENVELKSVRMFNMWGRDVNISAEIIAADKIEIHPAEELSSGMYVVSFENKHHQKRSVRVMIE
ncbi:T9SS type A sorting domain-containing protein [Dyadobacter psychrophilus]|uniref:Por secretion system C-terminal sorting domain-containing protein n=1 Tax=Dyadobacter psychrophilus TaxID=651661 RepID=A0A1T5CFJ0_9BACT|nr:T9SS type A sorting domain-containing protein [Dyadobacter psychrophilus]SKB58255.1 Por secretion system C-terminal sorting domain-containing protein [Dyadobacter psychrophilus]